MSADNQIEFWRVVEIAEWKSAAGSVPLISAYVSGHFRDDRRLEQPDCRGDSAAGHLDHGVVGIA